MQVEFTENLEFAVMIFIKEMIPPFLTDIFIITVTLHRFEPLGLSPSKLQTRSTGQVPTPSSSHSMRITLL